jgi:cytoskeletal protein CcmA (bactofilin family)
MNAANAGEHAHIGKSVTIRGELSGSEDLYIDGNIEGSIELGGNNLTIGPNGKVHANVNAKNVVVQGKLDGNIRTTEQTQLKSSAVAVGDIVSQRLSIEDGAYFKGKVDLQKGGVHSEPPSRPEAKVNSTPSASQVTNPRGNDDKTAVTDTKRN